ncbi:MAG: (2Fe-2S)-binding protein [Salinivirgaceae bacterium]|jgi:nitrite reductase (NADH) large subunit|nr:(2Fe-2S)-binding protein [Salinivirgaceae bacterium]
MERIVCYCNKVTEQTILKAIENGAKTVQDIGDKTKAGISNNCSETNPTGKCCIPEIKKLLNDNSPSEKSCCCCK